MSCQAGVLPGCTLDLALASPPSRLFVDACGYHNCGSVQQKKARGWREDAALARCLTRQSQVRW